MEAPAATPRLVLRPRHAASALAAPAAVAALVLAARAWPAPFWRAYLAAWLFWAGLPLGAAALLMVHHLTGGRWGWAVRRALETATLLLPAAALAFAPVLAHLEQLYPWAQPGAEHVPALAHRAPYLNGPFVLARAGAFLALWSAGGVALAWRSAREGAAAHGEDGRPAALAALGLVALVLTVSFAAVDWVMALEERWYSSIFGLYLLSGQALAALSLVVTLAALGRRAGGAGGPDALQDLASLLLVLVVLHGYLAFSQWLVTWSGNKPAEVSFYLPRLAGGWAWLAGALGVALFALPLVVLLFRRAKRSPRALAALGATLLLARAAEDAWLVLPSARADEGPTAAWLVAPALAALGALGLVGARAAAALRDRWAPLGQAVSA